LFYVARFCYLSLETKKIVLDEIPVLGWLCDEKYFNHFILGYDT
jgi:hypothetical protein